jgi:hypothetical protein
VSSQTASVLGWPLEEARERLASAGLTLQIVETQPRPAHAGRVHYGNRLRVVQQRQTDRGVLLVVARELAPGWRE